MAVSGFDDRDNDLRASPPDTSSAPPRPTSGGPTTSAHPPAHSRWGLITTARDLAQLIDAIESGGLLSPASAAAMTTPKGPSSDNLEGYGCELVFENEEVTIIGHGGHDPGVSALVSHWRASATTVVVVCNLDCGSWPVTQHIAADLELSDPRS